MPSLNGAVVLVTGANGGIGTHFVHEALEHGAAKVYATARSPRTWDDDRVVPLPLDVTSPASIQAAVDVAPDVSVLINNAGVSTSSPGILTHTDEEIRTNVETNFLGPLFLARAFAPILTSNDKSTLVQVHSLLSWYAVAGIYSATEAALGRRPTRCASNSPRTVCTWSACTWATSTLPWRRTPARRRRSLRTSCGPSSTPSRPDSTRSSPTKALFGPRPD